VVADKKIERIENSAVKLQITVKQADAKSEYDKLLQDYSKKAQIKGFRKGKVPVNILERKFGEGLKVEAGQNIIEECLKEVFDKIEEKPLPYAMPELDGELEFDFDKNFSFTVTYDVYPEIELGTYKELEIEESVVKILKEDETRELKAIQEQNAVVFEKEDGPVKKDNTVIINYVELDDDGNEKEETRAQDFTLTVGSGQNIYKIDDEILGMKKDKEKTIEKEYPEDFEGKDLAGKTIKLKVTVTSIKEKQLPAIDDELAQDISEKYETLEDLKKDIKKRLKETSSARIRQNKVKQIMDQVTASTKMEVPKSMVHLEMDGMWRNFVSQFRTEEKNVLKMLEMQNKTREDLNKEWEPTANERIRSNLIIQKMVETEKVEIDDKGIDEELKSMAETGGNSFEDLKDYYTKNNMIAYLKQDLTERKLFDNLLSTCTIKKGKSIKFLDLMQGND
jgi:trigger factor